MPAPGQTGNAIAMEGLSTGRLNGAAGPGLGINRSGADVVQRIGGAWGFLATFVVLFGKDEPAWPCAHKSLALAGHIHSHGENPSAGRVPALDAPDQPLSNGSFRR